MPSYGIILYSYLSLSNKSCVNAVSNTFLRIIAKSPAFPSILYAMIKCAPCMVAQRKYPAYPTPHLSLFNVPKRVPLPIKQCNTSYLNLGTHLGKLHTWPDNLPSTSSHPSRCIHISSKRKRLDLPLKNESVWTYPSTLHQSHEFPPGEMGDMILKGLGAQHVKWKNVLPFSCSQTSIQTTLHFNLTILAPCIFSANKTKINQIAEIYHIPE